MPSPSGGGKNPNPALPQWRRKKRRGAPGLERIADMRTWGVNYLRANFLTEAAQEAVAKHLLLRLAEIDD